MNITRRDASRLYWYSSVFWKLVYKQQLVRRHTHTHTHTTCGRTQATNWTVRPEITKLRPWQLNCVVNLEAIYDPRSYLNRLSIWNSFDEYWTSTSQLATWSAKIWTQITIRVRASLLQSHMARTSFVLDSMLHIYFLFLVALRFDFGSWPPLTGLRDHTTLGNTPLDEWSARRRKLYLTTHNTHDRQASIPWRDSNPQSQRASGHTATSQIARSLGPAYVTCVHVFIHVHMKHAVFTLLFLLISAFLLYVLKVQVQLSMYALQKHIGKRRYSSLNS